MRQRSVRLRLTLLYNALFLVAGGVLLAVTYLLAVHGPLPGAPDDPAPPEVSVPGNITVEPPAIDEPSVEDQLADQRDVDRRRLLAGSAVALAVMALASTGLGWYVAGRVLRPIVTMTATVRRLSADDLHRRLGASGPDDELKELADTFDDLLGRLEAAFESQRRFVANASHELRTPLTLQRSLMEVALADPDTSVASLRRVGEQVVAATQEQDRIVDALLVLARSQRGLDGREPLDMATLVRRLLDQRQDAIAARDLALTTTSAPAPLAGDPALVERLVGNLLDNALVHNVSGGWVEVASGSQDGAAWVRVANGGPVVPADQVDDLVQPFRRGGAERTGTGSRGVGVGLSIADAVATAHGGRLTLSAPPGGGLVVEVRLPHS